MDERESTENNPTDADNVTSLLNGAAGGDRVAATELFRRVHHTLRRIARQRMCFERKDHTLQPTALVNEVWMKLIGGKPIDWSGRRHFYAAAADAMRHILIDHARQRGAAKRGGENKKLPLNITDLAIRDDPQEILAIDDAISRLEQEEPDIGAVVRLRFFAGLSIEETAAALDQSPRNINRLWTYARARLYRILNIAE